MTIKAQKKATDAIQQAEDDTNIAAEIIKKVRENDINTNRENPNNNAINPYIFSIQSLSLNSNIKYKKKQYHASADLNSSRHERG